VPTPGRLDGLCCLIIGGTGGIGLAAARRFLQEGARVVVTGIEPAASDAAGDPLEIEGLVGHFTFDLVADDVDGLFNAATKALGGRLDVLLHAAGISGRKFGDGPLHECSDAGWQRVMETNARGVFLTNRAAVQFMLRQLPDAHGIRGSVVNVGSVVDRSPSPVHFGTFAYAASKGAVRAMTLAAAARYAPLGIRFNLLAPGLIDTPMAARAVNDPDLQPYLTTKQPLSGGPGSAHDVAEAALYLCEPASRFVTGVELPVDGGWSVSEGIRQREARPEPSAPK
jgi:NAD(P)-dependent dehydrogenase (short-subunit alcohol dehydrogenase family)